MQQKKGKSIKTLLLHQNRDKGLRLKGYAAQKHWGRDKFDARFDGLWLPDDYKQWQIGWDCAKENQEIY